MTRTSHHICTTAPISPPPTHTQGIPVSVPPSMCCSSGKTGKVAATHWHHRAARTLHQGPHTGMLLIPPVSVPFSTIQSQYHSPPSGLSTMHHPVSVPFSTVWSQYHSPCTILSRYHSPPSGLSTILHVPSCLGTILHRLVSVPFSMYHPVTVHVLRVGIAHTSILE